MKAPLSKGVVLASALLFTSLGPHLAAACSRILWDNDLGTYVARGEDWFEDAPTALWALPRGAVRVGAVADNLSAGAPVKRLPVNGNDLAFDATDEFEPAQMFEAVPGTENTLGGRRSL